MEKFLVAAFFIGAAILSSGCASPGQGRKFDDAYIAQIKKGVTTKAQIRQNFGDPLMVSKTADTETWIYNYSNAYGRGYIQGLTLGLVKEESDDQALYVVFTGNVVADYTYTK